MNLLRRDLPAYDLSFRMMLSDQFVVFSLTKSPKFGGAINWGSWFGGDHRGTRPSIASRIKAYRHNGSKGYRTVHQQLHFFHR